MRLINLVKQIMEIDGAARVVAGRTLQQILSLRNWLIGAHIGEFEQAGEARAAWPFWPPGFGRRLPNWGRPREHIRRLTISGSAGSQVSFELGRDFCFVARQFRITAGNRHHYIDLLLFHRRLRCLVAIDLKLGAFQPEHAGQLRFYVNYLAENVAYPEENPPVGILLCTERDAEIVRFATAGDSDLFVTRYQIELPTEEQLRQ